MEEEQGNYRDPLEIALDLFAALEAGEHRLAGVKVPLGSVLRLIGVQDEARQFLLDAQRVVCKLGIPDATKECDQRLGMLSLEDNDSGRIQTDLRRALGAFLKHGAHWNAAETYWSLGGAALAQGLPGTEFEDVYLCWMPALVVVESAQAQFTTPRARQFWRAKRDAWSIELLDLAVSMQHTELIADIVDVVINRLVCVARTIGAYRALARSICGVDLRGELSSW